jgi:phosphate transport system permease protein
MLVIAPLGLVFFHVLMSGIGAVIWNSSRICRSRSAWSGGGMANAIVGTLELLALASIIGIPVGVLGRSFSG